MQTGTGLALSTPVTRNAKSSRRQAGRGTRIWISSLVFPEVIMLYWAAVFFIIAIIAAVFGFGGVASGAASIATILFWVFLILFVLSLVFGLVRRPRV